jgi:hypothetical protein
MNHLVIVGNGFDLSLGQKTSYDSFLKHLFKKEIEVYKSFQGNNEPLPSTPWCHHFRIGYIEKGPLIYIEQEHFTLAQLIGNYTEKIKSFSYNQLNEMSINSFMKNSKRIIYAITSESSFITDLIFNHEQLDWVKIENKYYECLIELSIRKDSDDLLLSKSKRTNLIQSLNDEMSILTSELKKYLIEIQNSFNLEENFTDDAVNFYNNISTGSELYALTQYDRISSGINFKDRTLLLNFNYTNNISELFNQFSIKNFESLNVHGDLSDNSEMIFGFGHQPKDERYLKLLDLDIDGSLNHLKMFKYVKNRLNPVCDISVHDDFINNNQFQVTVIGHSCGISDANLLEGIFRHKHCKVINIAYHNDSSWQETASQIRMRMESDSQFRTKLMPLKTSLKMPQIKYGKEVLQSDGVLQNN